MKLPTSMRGDARNSGAHAVGHLAGLLQVGFARRVVDRRDALGQHGGHHDVGRAGYGCLIEQHVGAAQLVGLDHEEVVGDVEIELRAELLESQEVGVEAPASDFVAARAGNESHAEACQHRADEHHRAAQARAALAVVVRAQVVEVDVAGPERVGVVGELLDLDAHAAQQLDELQDIQDAGDVADCDPLGGQQGGTENLQRLVLGALGGDAAPETVASFDFEYCHGCCGVRWREACRGL